MTNELPTFVFIFGRYPDETEANCIKFLNDIKDTKYKILIFTSYKKLKSTNNKIKLIFDEQKNIDFPPNCLKKYKNIITDFIKN